MQRSISLEYQIKPPTLIKSDTLVTGMAMAGVHVKDADYNNDNVEAG